MSTLTVRPVPPMPAGWEAFVVGDAGGWTCTLRSPDGDWHASCGRHHGSRDLALYCARRRARGLAHPVAR